MKKLYENYVSHFILMLVFVCIDLNLYEICMKNLYEKYGFLIFLV
jgi:hypothetical protein